MPMTKWQKLIHSKGSRVHLFKRHRFNRQYSESACGMIEKSSNLVGDDNLIKCKICKKRGW